MKLPRVRYPIWRLMAFASVVAVLAGVVVPWFWHPSTPPAPAPTRPHKGLFEGGDINSNGGGPLAPDRPSRLGDRPSRLGDRPSGQRPLLPPDLGTSQ